MSLPARTALLALAALAALAVAAVRITSAAEHKTVVAERAAPTREVTPAQAAATLAKLRAPPGFRHVTQCRFAEARYAQRCFWTPRALEIDAHAVRRVSAFWGLPALGGPLLSGCSGPHHWRGGLVLRHCSWALELGPEAVLVYSDSLFVPPGPVRARTAAKALRYCDEAPKSA